MLKPGMTQSQQGGLRCWCETTGGNGPSM